MRGLRLARILGLLGLLAVLSGRAVLPHVGAAQPVPTFVDPAFRRAWEYSDLPVQGSNPACLANRSWTWGPAQNGAPTSEPYTNAYGTTRMVQYFEKARMEINNPGGNRNDPNFVSNGRLVVEMISGRIQIGENPGGGDRLNYVLPATERITGDNIDSNTGPTYASLYKIADIGGGAGPATHLPLGTRFQDTFDRSGSIGHNGYPHNDSRAAAAAFEGAPNHQHNIPGAFWTFLTQSGPVWDTPSGSCRNGAAFNWVSAMGWPITEPYWTQVPVGGILRWVLFQAFERRILTYTPSYADPQFRVEMGNVGLHYHDWRYGTPNCQDYLVVAAQAPAQICTEQNGQCTFANAVPSTSHVGVPGQAQTRAGGGMDLSSKTQVVRMAQNARARFQQANNSICRLLVELGGISAAHDPNGRQVFDINAGDEVDIMLTDSRVSVVVNPDGSVYIAVPTNGGSARVRLPSGDERLLEAHEEILIPPGAPTLPPSQPINPAEQARWDQVLREWMQLPGLIDQLGCVSEPQLPCPSPTPIAGFTVTGVQASVAPTSSEICPTQFNFTAVITASSAGTLRYTWERSDNAQAPIESLTFTGPGAQTVTDSWFLSAPGTHWERVHILAPTDLTSNQASFTLTCAPQSTAPAQISPPDGTVFNHYPRTTTLTWAPVAGAVTYVVEIDCYHCCVANQWCTDVGQTWSVVRNLTDTSYTFDFVGAQPGRWRVWAVDASGQEGPKSGWWTFSYTQ